MENPIDDSLPEGLVMQMNVPPPLPHTPCAAHLRSRKGGECSRDCPMFQTCGGGHLKDAEWFSNMYDTHGKKLLCRDPNKRLHKNTNPYCTAEEFNKRIKQYGGNVSGEMNHDMSVEERVRS